MLPQTSHVSLEPSEGNSSSGPQMSADFPVQPIPAELEVDDAWPHSVDLSFDPLNPAPRTSFPDTDSSNHAAKPATPFDPHCFNMTELPDASSLRRGFAQNPPAEPTPLSIHLSQGLAYTVGSALGQYAPTEDEILAAFTVPNKVGLTVGARAWSKHAHRSGSNAPSTDPPSSKTKSRDAGGWWGVAHGSVSRINERAMELFWRVLRAATWRNLHWLPHTVLVYEIRVPDGYGMRWSRDCSLDRAASLAISNAPVEGKAWMFRGCVEPMMENGHDVGWRH